MKLGGAAFVQHYVVRLILSWKGYAPFDYLAFLNSATRLFFLQQIGGGYEFIHRDFMEHFVLMVDTGEHTEEVDSINVVSS